MHATGCGFTKFPNISDIIDTLTDLLIGNNNVGTIDPQSLIGQDNFSSPEALATTYLLLKSFYMPEASLWEFPSELFIIFPNLKRQEIQNQKAHYTGKVPNFSLGQNLELIYIYHNQGSFTGFDFTPMFSNMETLSSVLMYGQHLTEFPFTAEFIVQNFSALKTLDLGTNLIE